MSPSQGQTLSAFSALRTRNPRFVEPSYPRSPIEELVRKLTLKAQTSVFLQFRVLAILRFCLNTCLPQLGNGDRSNNLHLLWMKLFGFRNKLLNKERRVIFRSVVDVKSCLSLPSPDMCTSSKTKTRVSTSALFTSKSSDKLSLPDIDQLERPPRTVIAPPTLLSGLVGIDLLVSNQFNPRGQGTIHENVLGPLNRKL